MAAKIVCSFSGRRTVAGAFAASSGVFLYDPFNDPEIDQALEFAHYAGGYHGV